MNVTNLLAKRIHVSDIPVKSSASLPEAKSQIRAHDAMKHRFSGLSQTPHHCFRGRNFQTSKRF
jgi:hypothetical protein